MRMMIQSDLSAVLHGAARCYLTRSVSEHKLGGISVAAGWRPGHRTRISLYKPGTDYGGHPCFEEQDQHQDEDAFQWISSQACVLWSLLLLCAGAVSSGSVQVPTSVTCPEGQDCILNCTLLYTAERRDENPGVTWRQAETAHIVHRSFNSTARLRDQLSQYVNRTSLCDGDARRGNAALLLRGVRQEDAGQYKCTVSRFGSGVIRLEVVPGPPTTEPAEPTTAEPAVTPRHHLWLLGPFLLLVFVCVWLCGKRGLLQESPAMLEEACVV
ncbi:CD276 antigen-like [Acipenser ruthenus]|uniref:CD276 antigen-like n=1 Tax=Acipenser ruthenus TaxID=7906 RepID=UPI002740AA6B|nr:CD276 antigen-like [Acipenser ruthenus]